MSEELLPKKSIDPIVASHENDSGTLRDEIKADDGTVLGEFIYDPEHASGGIAVHEVKIADSPIAADVVKKMLEKLRKVANSFDPPKQFVDFIISNSDDPSSIVGKTLLESENAIDVRGISKPGVNDRESIWRVHL